MVTNKQAMAALDAYTDSLTQLQNVIGVGIIQLGTNRSSDQAIGVYVEQKVPIEELDQSDMVPEVLVIEVDDQSVEIPTRVIEQGPVSKETL